MNIFGYLFFATFFVEWFYSYTQKDKVYTRGQASANFFTGLLIQLRSFLTTRYFFPVFFGAFAALFVIHISSGLTILSFITCLLSLDFMKYLYHRFEHGHDFFWMLHYVHHSDYQVNVGTASRASPFEIFFLYLFFIPLLFVGYSISTVFICYTTIVLYEIFVHNAYINLPKVFGYVIVTPAAHRIHHDSNPENYNKNFGAIFSIWDRALGTYLPTIDWTEYAPGIRGYRENNFIKIQTDPMVDYFKKLLKIKN